MYFPTALFVALRSLFSFWQAQYAQVFPLKPAPFCKLFVGLGSTNKFATSHLFSSSLTLAPPSFHLKLSGRSGRNCLLFPSFLSGYNGSPNTHFSRGTSRQISWPDGECYLRPLQSLVAYLLLSLVPVSTLLISRTGGVLSHLNSSTHRLPRFPQRNLCSLITLAVFSRLRCNGHSLQ